MVAQVQTFNTFVSIKMRMPSQDRNPILYLWLVGGFRRQSTSEWFMWFVKWLFVTITTWPLVFWLSSPQFVCFSSLPQDSQMVDKAVGLELSSPWSNERLYMLHTSCYTHICKRMKIAYKKCDLKLWFFTFLV